MSQSGGKIKSIWNDPEDEGELTADRNSGYSQVSGCWHR